VSWTPDGRGLLSGMANGELCRWHGRTFHHEWTKPAHNWGIRAMAVHSTYVAGDAAILTGDDKGEVRLWKGEGFRQLNALHVHKEPIRGLSLSPTKRKFATCSDDASIQIVDLLRFKQESELPGHRSDCRAAEWHATMSLLASCSRDCTIRLWDPRVGKQLAIT